MVHTRMEGRLDILERNLEAWRKEMEEDREIQETRRELQDAQMKKIEELLENLARNSLAENSGKEKSNNNGDKEMESGSNSGTRTVSSGQ